MIIALDYDKTYTRDPDMWNMFIEDAIKRNHEVICVTMRYPSEGDDVEKTIGRYCTIIYTERRAKEQCLLKLNIYPDIWIDDSPFWIYKDGIM